MNLAPWNQTELDRKRSIALSVGMWFTVVAAPVALLLRWSLWSQRPWAGVVYVLVAGWLAWFLYRRSKGFEAKILTLRVVPEDPWETQRNVDWMAVLGAFLLPLYAATGPWW